MQGEQETGKVIDLVNRVSRPDLSEPVFSGKVRFDLEKAKVAVSTSLLSVVLLATLANNQLLSSSTSVERDIAEASTVDFGSRGIASVTSMSSSSPEEKQGNSKLLKELARRDLSPSASVGQKPTALEKLAFGTLEGKYAVRMQDGILKEIELSGTAPAEAKSLESVSGFLSAQRELLPRFDHVVKVGSDRESSSGNNVEVYQLVNQISMPVAKVEVRMTGTGRLSGLRVFALNQSSK